jgi:hypothetical protein
MEQGSNRCETCHAHECHSAELDGIAICDDRLHCGVALLDEVTPGRGCTMRNWPSGKLKGIECA